MMSKKGENIKIEQSTPVMRQFQAVKTQYSDAVVLFRMGDFYETFQEDAKTCSKILNITLTKRANGKASTVPLAGFPYHALENYLHKLLKAGHKVAICEQVEDPKTAKGIVKREVVEVITPGTAVTNRFLEETKNNYLVSVIINKKDVGIAAIDASTGEFFLMDATLIQLKEKVLSLHPSEIICRESQFKEIKALFNNVVLRVTPIDDWIYDYESAYHTMIEQFETTSLKGFGCEDSILGVQAAGPILSYLKQNFMTNLSHVNSIQYQTDDDVVLIDNFTQRNLEIFQTMQNGNRRGSLIEVLDQTVTPMGSRLLKKWLIRPLQKVAMISSRLNQVEFFVNEYITREKLRNLLSKCSDLERLLSRLSANRANSRDLLLLRSTLELIPEITDIIKAEKQFNNLRLKLNALKPLKNILDKAIKDQDLPLSIKAGGFILEGYNKELDEFRYLVKHGKEWIANLQASERKKLGIPSLKIKYNKVFGYYIDITKVNIDKVPDNYIRKQTLVNSERFITEELKKYEEKLLSAEDKMGEIEYKLFLELRDLILDEIKKIQQNAYVLANLDTICGFAELSEKNNYCRPEINNGPELYIKDGRHPVVEYLLPPGEKFVTNDLDTNNLKKQILIITGPNMAGKSAESARIGVVDKIFTRVGASDNLAAGESTFLMEMNETANILNNVTPNSLVLLDEIGRGTSTYDGMAIAWAVTEYLHNTSRVAAKTLFATHYHELTELEKLLPRVVNLNVAVKEYGNRIVFLRKIIPGGCDKSYGIHVAQMAGVPGKVIHRANEILANLSTEEWTLPTDSQHFKKMEAQNPNQLGLFDKRESELRDKLTKVDVDNMTPIEALQKLNELKKKYGL